MSRLRGYAVAALALCMLFSSLVSSLPFGMLSPERLKWQLFMKTKETPEQEQEQTPVSGAQGVPFSFIQDTTVNAPQSLVIPKPQKETYGSGTVELRKGDFQFRFSGHAVSSEIIRKAVERYEPWIFSPFWAIVKKGGEGNTPGSNLRSEAVNQHLNSLTIDVESDDETLDSNLEESYELSVSNDKNKSGALLKAKTVYGALRGLETFAQLIQFSHLEQGSKPVYIIANTPVQISDHPRFPYRGLLIDTSRHYLPVQLILDNLDMMSFHKMNVLHWHVTDTESFPYESSAYPELSKKGAFRFDHVYTADDVQTIIREAKLRGIRVIAEFDTPAHSGCWGKSMPDIMAHCPTARESVNLNPTINKTYEVLTNLYKEFDSVFPDDYIFLGGDEVDYTCWKKDPRIAKWMKDHASDVKSYQELENYFLTKLLAIVKNNTKKKTIVWQEMFNNHLNLDNTTVVDVWMGQDKGTLSRATAKGFKVILSGCWYLDHLGDDWQALYRCEPTDFEGSAAQKALVMGGHAAMWGERCDAANFMTRVWPRSAAVAERLWSDVNVKDQGDAYRRIHHNRCRLINRGFVSNPVYQNYCDREVHYHPVHLPHSKISVVSEKPSDFSTVDVEEESKTSKFSVSIVAVER